MSGNSRRACSIPAGSYARTLAPKSSSPVTSGIEGASRMSSVSGLKVRPSTAKVLPRRLPPAAWATLRAIARLRLSLTASTASMIRSGTSWSSAIFTGARVSFGTHEPPKPGPGMQEFRADTIVQSDATRDCLVGVAVAASRRGADRDEPASAWATGAARSVAKLGGDRAAVLVHAGDLVADVREARARHQPH